MANYKAPRTVQLVDELPLNASGKVLKYELRARAMLTRASTGVGDISVTTSGAASSGPPCC